MNSLPTDPAPPPGSTAAEAKPANHIYHEPDHAQILEVMRQPVLSVDDQGIIQYLNTAAEHYLGLPDTPTTGRTLCEVLAPLVDTEEPLENLIAKFLDGNEPTHVHLRLSEASHPILEISSVPFIDADGRHQGRIVTFNLDRLDATVETGGQREHRDGLTGLLNRMGLEQQLDTLIHDATSSSRTHAFLMMDMDQFKLINDLSGHRAGDVLLKQIGEHLEVCVHEGDTVARLGGDEFGILLRNVEANEAASVGRRLLSSIQGIQFTWDGRIFPLSASIGIVPITERTRQAKLAMSHADTALYAAKEAGRNRLHLYTPSDEAIVRSNREMEWAEHINQALNQNMFRLAAQPIKALRSTDTGDHYEVLIRMQQGDELVAPGAFLPAAERFGLMDKIDRWVVTTFVDYLERYPQKAEQLTQASLNLSGTSLAEEGFLKFLIEQISRPHVQPEKLCFEVTETAAITNITHARLFIEEIHAKGCRFSLDDFGSGMSSFGYLRQLPVDFLKIDGVFVRDLDSDPVHRAMVKAINEVSHAMGKQTIAEFVVSEQIMQILEEMGVDYAQGYFISEPKLLDMPE